MPRIITELRHENFKRLKAVRINPNRGLVQITGKNAQGKTSVLDGIAALIGGKKLCPDKAIRKGEKRAESWCRLSDLTGVESDLLIRRSWTSDTQSYLEVTGPNGDKYGSPQAILDKLTGSLSFDPLGFSRLDKKKRAETLRALAGLDTSDLDKRYAELYGERTRVGRDVDSLKGQLQGIVVPTDSDPNALKEEKSAVDLAKKHAAAKDALSVYNAAYDELYAAKKRVADLELALGQAREAYDTALSKTATIPEPPDIDAIEKEMVDLEGYNRIIRAAKDRARQAADAKMRLDAKATEVKEADDKYRGLTAQLDTIQEEKTRRLEAAKFPVDGLAVDGDDVTFNGLPFEQASGAEQLRISLAIGAALNPGLHVLLVRDGSLLDDDSLAQVAEWADEHQFQVWLEKVATDSPVGIVIEDGEVLEDHQNCRHARHVPKEQHVSEKRTDEKGQWPQLA